MTPQAKEAIAIVDRKQVELAKAATNEQVRTKLGNLHEVCRILIVEAAQRPTVPEVIRRYKARYPAREQNLAEQSLRNKRGGANPYAVLYAAWAGAAEFVLVAKARARQQPSPNELLSTDDVAGISDTALRHRIGLVLAQNRSLKSQLDILKSLGNAPVVRLSSGDGGFGHEGQIPLSNNLALTDAEVDAVQAFIEPRRLKARGLRRAQDGAVESLDGRALSEPGFAEALDKIVQSYGR